jgi:hypothetical protein
MGNRKNKPPIDAMIAVMELAGFAPERGIYHGRHYTKIPLSTYHAQNKAAWYMFFGNSPKNAVRNAFDYFLRQRRYEARN